MPVEVTAFHAVRDAAIGRAEEAEEAAVEALLVCSLLLNKG
jgi:hypothetical protein